VRLPDQLRAAIEDRSARLPPRELATASAELSRGYRNADFTFRTPAHRLAYLQVRLPATYAALHHVLAETALRIPDWRPQSLLDLGAGPGTAAWAATAVFPSLARFTLIERDSQMAELGRELASSHALLSAARWLTADVSAADFPESDLVVASYTIGELPDRQRAAEVRRAWAAARVLVLIEPGTRRGFEHVLAARADLISAGASLVAPCPHALACPMAAAGDWCHFSERVERSAAHRRLKGADLGYEDEKFSYVVAAKDAATSAAARIVRHPLHHGGHTQLLLCTPAGLEKRTITRSQKDLYRRARKSVWGGAWEER
jgi:ribosomal protein RSM22 (predicted rRNA methylase)